MIFSNKPGRFKPAINEYNGKFTFVGSIPENICIKKTNSIGQEYLASPVYNTREEAEAVLKTI